VRCGAVAEADTRSMLPYLPYVSRIDEPPCVVGGSDGLAVDFHDHVVLANTPSLGRRPREHLVHDGTVDLRERRRVVRQPTVALLRPIRRACGQGDPQVAMMYGLTLFERQQDLSDPIYGDRE
jgi:hypothetical protein